jgi:hypothetical protein
MADALEQQKQVLAPSETLVTKAQADKMAPQSGKLARVAAFTPQTLTEAIALSKLIANSELAPKDFKGKPANVLIAMQMGAEVGLAPMAALQNIAVINGRPSLWGDGALAVVMSHPDYDYHKETMVGEGDNRIAVFEIKRKGHEVAISKFSVAEAKQAGLWKKEGTWQTYPERMLKMRARGFGMRDKFPDALRGMAIAEEAMDIPQDTSPAKQRREEGTLDMVASIGDLTPSSEPNRGHDHTGLQRTKSDEQNQPAPKQEVTICSECRQQITADGKGHAPDCITPQKSEQDKRTSKPTDKALYLVLVVNEKFKKGKGGVKGSRYLVLDVVIATPAGDKEGKLYVWHKSFSEFFPVGKCDQRLVAEVSEQEKDGKKFFQLEHILELGGIPFVNDKPAQQGNLNIDPGPVPDDEWEEEGESGKETGAAKD